MSRARRLAPWLLALVAIPAVARAAGDVRSPEAHWGGWIATVGSPSGTPFHGSWSAQVLFGNRDDVYGSWEMFGPRGDITMKGTWAARRAKRGLKGTWSARLPSNAVLSGRFEANVPGFKGKTLEDMLAATLAMQVAGTWRMGGLRGHWWLRGGAGL